MFSKDTVTIDGNFGTPTSTRPINFACDPGELLTGFSVRYRGEQSHDDINSWYAPICTNVVTGVNKVHNDIYTGTNKNGAQRNLRCPAGRYISGVQTATSDFEGAKVLGGIGITCKDLNGNQLYNESVGGNEKYKLMPSSCPSGYFVNQMDVTGGYIVNTLQPTCVNMKPRINVLKNTPTTAACCTGQGDPVICGEYIQQSGKCDKYFQDYCATNPNDLVCSCFDVPQGIPPCYATACLNHGYITKNMKESCPTQYVSCDVQINAQNSGVSIAPGYNLEQNCGRATAPGTTTATTPVPPANNFIYQFILIILVFVGILFTISAYRYTKTGQFKLNLQ